MCDSVELQYSILKFRNLKLKIVRTVLVYNRGQLGQSAHIWLSHETHFGRWPKTLTQPPQRTTLQFGTVFNLYFDHIMNAHVLNYRPVNLACLHENFIHGAW